MKEAHSQMEKHSKYQISLYVCVYIQNPINQNKLRNTIIEVKVIDQISYYKTVYSELGVCKTSLPEL